MKIIPYVAGIFLLDFRPIRSCFIIQAPFTILETWFASMSEKNDISIDAHSLFNNAGVILFQIIPVAVRYEDAPVIDKYYFFQDHVYLLCLYCAAFLLT